MLDSGLNRAAVVSCRRAVIVSAKEGANMTWLDYLLEQRAQKLGQIDALETGNVQLFELTDGVTSEVTGEQLVKLKSDVAEIRQVFIDEGIAPDA
ncbi:MAG: hypothetical protein LH610_00670 [Sphingomonas bacterium]|nr:hypothetical protein [Sphingomonas bacterium]